MQVITIMGNLTSDAEARNGNNNAELMTFRVACNENSGDNSVTTFYDVTNRKTGLFDYLKKGQMVTVVGRLKASAKQGDNGNVFLNLNIMAFEIRLAGSRN